MEDVIIDSGCGAWDVVDCLQDTPAKQMITSSKRIFDFILFDFCSNVNILLISLSFKLS